MFEIYTFWCSQEWNIDYNLILDKSAYTYVNSSVRNYEYVWSRLKNEHVYGQFESCGRTQSRKREKSFNSCYGLGKVSRFIEVQLEGTQRLGKLSKIKPE